MNAFSGAISYTRCRYRGENRRSHATVVFLGDKKRDKSLVDATRGREEPQKNMFSLCAGGKLRMLVYKPHNHTRLGSFDLLRIMYHE